MMSWKQIIFCSVMAVGERWLSQERRDFGWVQKIAVAEDGYQPKRHETLIIKEWTSLHSSYV